MPNAEMITAIARASAHARFLEVASERYNDLAPARRVDGETIYTSWLAHDDTNEVEFVADRKNPGVMIYVYLTVEGGRVYSARRPDMAALWLHHIALASTDSAVAAFVQKILVSAAKENWGDIKKLMPKRK
jgi:hypothetical protein